MAPLICAPGIPEAAIPLLNGASSPSREKLQQNVEQERSSNFALFSCFSIPLTSQAFSIVTYFFGFCLLDFSGTLSPRSGQSCREADGTAKYQFSIPPRQHRGVRQAPLRHTAGEALRLLFYKFRVCLQGPARPIPSNLFVSSLAHLSWWGTDISKFADILAIY